MNAMRAKTSPTVPNKKTPLQKDERVAGDLTS